MWIEAVFENEYGPVSGLSPTVKIKDLDGAVVVSDASMSEVGYGFDGVYVYDFTLYDSTKDYVVICDSVTLSGSSRYSYGATGEYNDILNINTITLSDIDINTESIQTIVNSHTGVLSDIESTITDVDVRTTLLRKIQTNKLVLSDGNTDNWILYDDDDITPLLIFSVKDKDDNSIIQPSYVPSIRYKAEEN